MLCGVPGSWQDINRDIDTSGCPLSAVILAIAELQISCPALIAGNCNAPRSSWRFRASALATITDIRATLGDGLLCASSGRCNPPMLWLFTTVERFVAADWAPRSTARMIIERCRTEHFEDWVRLRQALWPAETTEEHRKHAASSIDRSKDAVVYVAHEQGSNIIVFAEATLRRDYVNGCSTSPVGFLEGLYVTAPYRGRGLARLLNRAREQWARWSRLHRVRLRCLAAQRVGSESARSPGL